MNFPNALSEAICEVIASRSSIERRRRSEQLSKIYREGGSLSQLDQEAYLISRMPATYASIASVLEELGAFEIRSLLDLGAGPGTGMWAAAEIFPYLAEVTNVERDGGFIELGKQLAYRFFPSKKVCWLPGDLSSLALPKAYDLVLFSYSIGEIPASAFISSVKSAWQKTAKALVLIEPGTPRGFSRMRQIREELIKEGAFLMAPCPHHDRCPMTGDDWCHFATRLARSQVHRMAKGGTLNYEDEKFSYLIFTRDKCPLPASRILRHPQKKKGHVVFTLCTPCGIKQQTISKKDQEKYRLARKCHWGDAQNP